MHCFKSLFFSKKNALPLGRTNTAIYAVFCSALLLVPSSANAAQPPSYSNGILIFVLGAALPIVIYCLWYYLVARKGGSQEHHISKDELFNYTHDLTTNLPTAQYALKHFAGALKQDAKRRMAAIVFKPVNFQQVNTVLGHHNSDILLLQLAYCLQQKLVDNQNLLSFDFNPEPVRLARLQGLDFLVVFDLSTTQHSAKQVIDDLCLQLMSAVPEAMSFKSFSLNFELAFGVAISEEHGSSVSEIVSYASDALLKGALAKQAIQYFDNSSVLYTEKQLALMERLRQDIIAEDLRWLLQPQVNITNNTIVGFELKVHWYQGNQVPLALPDFIDLAEHSGEVYRLTKQMFKQVFNVLLTLNKLGCHQRVSISLSSKSLLEPDLVDFIEQQLKSVNILGKCLVIELTEPVMLAACQRAKSTIDQLKSLGIAISIANFSGSYESLRYLRKMAIHQVKINCQQLASAESHYADKAIINALITLTRGMNIPLIGTHIEKHEVAKDFMAMGGELVQGNIINSGIVPEDIESWLTAWFTQHPEAKSSLANSCY